MSRDITGERGPRSGPAASGRFVLRLEPAVHAALRAAAAQAGLSLNEYCARRLTGPRADVGKAAAEAIERAATVLGADLAGVVVFGSWARDEATAGSDVDLLVVVDARRPITRALYRAWDDGDAWWDGHAVEPHFVHLPPAGATPTGLWAEIAMEGIVLFERELAVSRRLVELRRRIADGRIVRRRVHGQAYWVEAA